jgi:hypothetical protein
MNVAEQYQKTRFSRTEQKVKLSDREKQDGVSDDRKRGCSKGTWMATSVGVWKSGPMSTSHPTAHCTNTKIYMLHADTVLDVVFVTLQGTSHLDSTRIYLHHNAMYAVYVQACMHICIYVC